MHAFTQLVAILLLFAISEVSLSQDPFGGSGGGGADPFGDSGDGADPFGGSGRGGADPFGDSGGHADPFGGGGGGADPFGGSDPFADGGPRQQTSGRRVAVADAVVAKAVPRRSSSEVNKRIRDALDDQTTQTFIDTPLDEALQLISETHDIPVVLDRRALEECGLTTDTPVRISLQNVSLRSFLRLMMHDLELTYIIKDEVLQVTTPAVADNTMMLEMYPFPEMLTDKSEQVLAALTSSVHSDQWSTTGGPCNVSVIDNVLVVSASESVHEGVIDFLQKLQAAFERHLAKK